MNISRNLQYASFLQNHGVNVVPNVRCLGKESYKYAFFGIPKHSTIAVGSYGNIRNGKAQKQVFYQDFDKTLDVLEPKRVIIYGSVPDDLIHFSSEVEFIQIENYTKTKINKNPVLLRQQENEKSDNFVGVSPDHFITNFQEAGDENGE